MTGDRAAHPTAEQASNMAQSLQLYFVPYQLGETGKQLLKAAAKMLHAQAERIGELEREGSALAANQCHDGYGDAHGHHQCKLVDYANSNMRKWQELAEERQAERDALRSQVAALREFQPELEEWLLAFELRKHRWPVSLQIFLRKMSAALQSTEQSGGSHGK